MTVNYSYMPPNVSTSGYTLPSTSMPQMAPISSMNSYYNPGTGYNSVDYSGLTSSGYPMMMQMMQYGATPYTSGTGYFLTGNNGYGF